MTKYRVLTLTDHYTHCRGESIYGLLKTMACDPQCMEIYLATRSDPNNKYFFTEFDGSYIYAKRVDKELNYNESGDWFLGGERVCINEFNVLFLRIDRPLADDQLRAINKNYKNMLIINNPNGIIVTGSKQFLFKFPELCPDISLCKNIDDVTEQLEMFPLVLKPLDGYGGNGLIKIDNNHVFFEDTKASLEEGLPLIGRRLKQNGAMLGMRYFTNVDKGDKRVVVVGNKVLGATLRLPADGSWLCNLKHGGQASYAKVDANEYEIAEIISPILHKYGILIFGFDTLEDDNGARRLSEINTLNVGGLLQAQEFSKQPVIQNASDIIWQYIDKSVF